ncbi:hypothetical protein ACIBK9_47075 [Nonomuraea sp. NPDC050227]|uniref:hypothetical protein n=1 Tax=Nonomuraea sp. NPDC050227 TaxID=3364360 RepID=UPI0037A3D532
MADRTVTVRLDADVKPYMSALAKAEAATKRLRDAMSGDLKVDADTRAATAQIQALQREVDRLSGKRTTVSADADTARAQAELDELRRRLDELNVRRVMNVDLDDGAARSELGSIQRDLERLNATSADPKVRVDSAAALAQVRTIQSEMARVDGRSAKVKVDADVSGALRNIAIVAAALASLPSAVSIGVGVAGLGAAFGAAAAGAAGFAAVAVPGISRVTDALKQAETAGGGAGGAMKSAAQKAAEAASAALRLAEAQDRVTDSAQAVKSAQQAVRDAMAGVRSAQQDAARAAEDAADRQAQAAARIADAERSVQDAHRATQRAIEDLTRARERAQERIEDLALATERGALSEERAQLSIRRARAELQRILNDPKASALDKEDAALRLREAELSLREIQERNGDLAKEREEADRKGVEGSDEVVAAKERILDAQQREADAERALADARAESARAARDGARDVADANTRVADAQRKVADAQQALVKAQRDHLRAVQALKVEQLQQKAALEQTGGAAGGAASKMAELSAEEKKLAAAIKSFQEDYLAWQRSLQPDVFSVIEKGLDVLRVGMDRATPLVKGGAAGLDRFADSAKKALESKEWTNFFDDLGRRAPDAIAGLGNAAINVAGGLRGIVEGFLPYTGPLTDWVESITQDFEDWGTNLKDSPEFKEFLAYAAEQGPKVAEIVRNIAEFIGNVAAAGGQLGPGVLDFFVSLSEKLASLQPAQVEAIAKGVAAIFTAAKLGTTLKLGGFVLLADVLSKMSPGQIQALAIAIVATVSAVKGYQAVTGAVEWWQTLSGSLDKAGKSAEGAKGRFSGLSGTLKAGGMAAVLAAVAVVADKVGDALSGLNPDIDGLAKQMASLAQQSRPAAAQLNVFGSNLDTLAGDMARSGTWFAPVVGQFESLGDTVGRLTSSNPFAQLTTEVASMASSVTGDLYSMDTGRQRLENFDKTLTQMVQSGNSKQAAALFNELAKQAGLAGGDVDKLRALLPGYSSAAAAAQQATAPTGDALKDLGNSADGAATNVDTLRSAISQLTSLTATAMQSEINYKRAVDDAAASIRENGRAHDTNSEAGRRNREALIGLAEKANAYRDALIEQGTPLDEVTRKVGAQRDSFIGLAEKMGFSRKQAEELATKLGLIPGNVKTDVKTPGGKEALDLIREYEKKLRELDGKTITTTIREYYIRKQENLKARAGGIFAYAEGGIQRFAAGGRSTPPNMATGPTILYGEGADQEAFIPYEQRYRSRAIDLLSQVASDFGLEVYSAQASQQVQSLTSAIDATSMQVGTGLTGAVSALQATLGQAGSLTSSISQVGASAEQLDQSWLAGSQVIGDSINLLGAGVDGLSGSVYELTQTMAAIGSKGAVGASAKKTTGSLKGKSGGFVEGNQPKKPAGGMVSGSQPVSGYASSGPVNASKVSKPQQISGSYGGLGGSYGAGSNGSGSASVAPQVTKTVNFYGTTVKETVDSDILWAKADLYTRG